MHKFPFGPAPLLMLLASIGSGIYLAANPVPRSDATIEMLVFAQNQLLQFGVAGRRFELENHGVDVDIQQINYDALRDRVPAAIWADVDVPDIVAIEISIAGMFFRGPEEKIGFIDLKPYIERDGLDKFALPSRLAPYTHNGHIYALPNDVSPVALAYRADLFEQYGIDPDEIETWADLEAHSSRLRREGVLDEGQFILSLDIQGPSTLEVMLFQRDGGYFNADGDLIMDNETAVETLVSYVPMVAGEDKMASSPGDQGRPDFYTWLYQGKILSFVCPDWKTQFTEIAMPDLSGKLKLMPLPAAKPGGRRVSTWGGTGLAISKKCENPELAWEFIKFAYRDREIAAGQVEDTRIIPGFTDLWDMKVLDNKIEYWSGQAVDRLYADLAPDVPPQYSSPFVQLAKMKLSEALAASVTYYERHGQEGFEPFVRARLKQAADDVRRQMKRDEVWQ